MKNVEYMSKLWQLKNLGFPHHPFDIQYMFLWITWEWWASFRVVKKSSNSLYRNSTVPWISTDTWTLYLNNTYIYNNKHHRQFILKSIKASDTREGFYSQIAFMSTLRCVTSSPKRFENGASSAIIACNYSPCKQYPSPVRAGRRRCQTKKNYTDIVSWEYPRDKTLKMWELIYGWKVLWKYWKKKSGLLNYAKTTSSVDLPFDIKTYFI